MPFFIISVNLNIYNLFIFIVYYNKHTISFYFFLMYSYSFKEQAEGYSPTEELECAVQNCLSATRDLFNQLVSTTREQTSDLTNITKAGSQLVSVITNSALACDEIRSQHSSQCFNQHIEHIVEVINISFHLISFSIEF